MAVASANGASAAYDANSGTASLSVPLTGVAVRQAMLLQTLPRMGEVMERLPTRFQIEQQANNEFRADVTGLAPVNLRYRDPTNEAALKAAGGQVPMLPVPPERSYRRGTVSLTSSSMWQLESLRIDWPYWSIKSLDVQVRGSGEYQWRLEATYVAAYQ